MGYLPVITENDAVQTCFRSHHCIFPALYTLQDHLHISCCFPQLCKIIPVQRGVDKGRYGSSGTLIPPEIVFAARLLRTRCTFKLCSHILSDLQHWRVLCTTRQVTNLLSPTQLRSINGDEQRLDSSISGMLDDLLRPRSIGIDISTHISNCAICEGIATSQL